MENKDTLAQKVYDCAEREHSAFIAEMKTHGADYIVEHAYEIVIMDDLMMLFENAEFSQPELQVIDAEKTPLTTLYREWLRKDDGHMEELQRTVQDFTGDRLRNTADLLYSDPAVPRYAKSAREAGEQDEIYLYRASHARDLACLHFFESGVSSAHEAHQIKSFTKDWAEQFSRDRCKFILGYSVKRADWDARYAPEAKRDAQKYEYGDEKDAFNHFSDFGTNTHPCLVDCSYRILMDMEHSKIKHEKER